MIPYNKPPYTGNEEQYVIRSLNASKLSGDGEFCGLCHQWFENHFHCAKALLTPSCTHALEMAAILLDIKPGDEVIMPSFTFVSTANAFVLRGARIVFVDIRPDTLNIDETRIESAITSKTRAIVPVHYAGVSCEMDSIMEIARKHNLFVVEDAAQGIMSYYKGKPLGSIGHLAAMSFHETKNITSGGEGGLLIINDPEFVLKAEIIREKGTNRNKFFRGMVDKYSWVDLGSSYLMSELQAAYLWGQLQHISEIQNSRLNIWNSYYRKFSKSLPADEVQLPSIPEDCTNNGHIFYLKLQDLNQRNLLIEHLKSNNIVAVFHYVPLHTSPMGKTSGRFAGQDLFTTKESERLLRLPLFNRLSNKEVRTIIDSVTNFF